MNEDMSLGKYSLKAGLITGAVAVLLTLAAKVEGLEVAFEMLRMIALILLTIYFVRSYRDRYCGGYLSKGKIFSITLLIFVYVGLIAAVYHALQFDKLSPEEHQTLISTAEQVYAENGIDVSSLNWDAAIAVVPYVTGVMMFLGHVILGSIFGLVNVTTLRREAPYNQNDIQ